MVNEKEIREGAEAKIYFGKFLGFDCAVKDRIRKAYRDSLLDEAIRKQRTRKEAKIIAVASENGLAVPSLLWSGDTKMAITRIRGTMLNELLQVKMEKRTAYNIFNQTGFLLAKLHNIGITHGDFTPANLVFDGDGKVWAIDFGLADFGHSPEEMALDLLLMKRSVYKANFAIFLASYTKESGKRGAETLKRLNEIERRGRYQTRTLLTS